ncbi:MAG: carbonic anhydrase [Flavobacteriaceae bacterium]
MLPEKLAAGHRRFRTGRLAHERDRYEELARTGQRPETMIIGCCDSRAGPETIFDASPGELFIVRNVANVVPPYTPDGEHHGTSAALEFAVQALKVKHIVVMGHGRCGGISAFLDEAAEPLSPGDFIGNWMSLIAPAKAHCDDHAAEGRDLQGRMERASVANSIDNLMTFPCVRILAERGRLTLHGAWFDISTGELETLDRANGRFVRLD